MISLFASSLLFPRANPSARSIQSLLPKYVLNPFTSLHLYSHSLAKDTNISYLYYYSSLLTGFPVFVRDSP